MAKATLRDRASVKWNIVLPCRVAFLKHYVRNGFRARRAFVYPEKPHPRTALYRVCHSLGMQITQSAPEQADVVVQWRDDTVIDQIGLFNQLHPRKRVLNVQCLDISKTTVEEIHKQVFGYGLAVDPLTHPGPCVVKSDFNGLHLGRIVQCPIPAREPDCVYQRLIHNEVDDQTTDEVRVPVYGEQIPLCYYKQRDLTERFSAKTKRVALREPHELFSDEELRLLVRFAREIRLDFGELDVLRDHQDGRLYVVDVNHTPYGPPRGLCREDAWTAIRKLATAFEANFLNGPPPPLAREGYRTAPEAPLTSRPA